MSAHLSEAERWHEEAVQLCLASTEHTSGVGHHRADVYGPCTTHLDAAKHVAARVASAVAAEREAWVVEWEWGVTQESDGIVRRGLTEQAARSVASRGDGSDPRYVMRRALGPWERADIAEARS